MKPGFVKKQTPRKQTRNEIRSDLVNFSFRITIDNKELNIGDKENIVKAEEIRMHVKDWKKIMWHVAPQMHLQIK
jgi:hypothetical protein